jgi:DNA-binding response OmpR family regulator
VAVKADELIRKPFQPQDLIGRVKSLLEPKRVGDAPVVERPSTSSALNNLFTPTPPTAPRPTTAPPPAAEQRTTDSIWPRALAEAFIAPRSGEASQQNLQQPGAHPARPAPTAADIQKLRSEIARLDLLVKKLQTEMQIERQYTQALELQIQTLTRVD